MSLLRALAVLFLLTLPALGQTEDPGTPPGTWFPVDELNPGLGEAPSQIDRETPQGTVESFLDAIDRGDTRAAAHLLNLSGMSSEDQSLSGPVLASQLHSVLQRRAIISWRTLMERPDSLDARTSSSAAMAGQPRRSLLIGVLALGNREVAIRLNRVKPPDGDPVWLFADRTVEQVPALYEEYGPTALEQALPDWLRKESYFGPRVFELIGLPFVIILAWIAGRSTYRLFKLLSRRSDGHWSQIALHAVRWPMTIVVTTSVILFLALNVFTVSGNIASILTPITLIGYVVAFLMFAMSILDTALDRMVTMDSDRLADPENSTVRNYATVITGARRVLIVFGVVAGLGIVLASANMFRSLGCSLLASAGALTLIIGFAARHVLGNILASLQIAINRSARIGDQLVYNGQFVTVERIHFTYVQLKTMKDNRLVVPVSHFVGDAFENWSMTDGGMTGFALITFAQSADLPEIRKRFEKIVEDEPLVVSKDTAAMYVMGQDALGMTVRFSFRIDEPNQTWVTERAIMERLMIMAQELEEETGRITLPQAAMDADGA